MYWNEHKSAFVTFLLPRECSTFHGAKKNYSRKTNVLLWNFFNRMRKLLIKLVHLVISWMAFIDASSWSRSFEYLELIALKCRMEAKLPTPTLCIHIKNSSINRIIGEKPRRKCGRLRDCWRRKMNFSQHVTCWLFTRSHRLSHGWSTWKWYYVHCKLTLLVKERKWWKLFFILLAQFQLLRVEKFLLNIATTFT